MTDFPTTGGSFSRDPETGNLSRQDDPDEMAPAAEATVDPALAAQTAPTPRRTPSKGGL